MTTHPKSSDTVSEVVPISGGQAAHTVGQERSQTKKPQHEQSSTAIHSAPGRHSIQGRGTSAERAGHIQRHVTGGPQTFRFFAESLRLRSHLQGAVRGLEYLQIGRLPMTSDVMQAFGPVTTRFPGSMGFEQAMQTGPGPATTGCLG